MITETQEFINNNEFYFQLLQIIVALIFVLTLFLKFSKYVYILLYKNYNKFEEKTNKNIFNYFACNNKLTEVSSSISNPNFILLTAVLCISLYTSATLSTTSFTENLKSIYWHNLVLSDVVKNLSTSKEESLDEILKNTNRVELFNAFKTSKNVSQGLADELVLSSYVFLILLLVFGLFSILYLGYDHLISNVRKVFRLHFDNVFIVIRPYVTNKDFNKFKSEYVQIDDEHDFSTLLIKLYEIVDKNGLKIKKIDLTDIIIEINN